MIYMFLAEGFEEIEALATLDVMRRAGINIKTVGVTGKYVTGSHNITVESDLDLNEITTEDLKGVILPGGLPGTTNLEKCPKVIEYVMYSANNKKLVAAICAAPSVLGHLNLLEGKNATCFPGFETELLGANATGDYVVCDGNFITGRGAGAAVDFGLEIVKYFKGADFSNDLRKTMQCAH